jgi:hypothetical protein
MRNGRLLVERSPDSLLKEHDTNLLEKIVLKLCLKDEIVMNGTEDSESLVYAKGISSSNSTIFSETMDSNVDHEGLASNIIGLTFKKAPLDEEVRPAVCGTHKTIHFPKSKFWQTIFALFLKNMLVMLRNWRYENLLFNIHTVGLYAQLFKAVFSYLHRTSYVAFLAPAFHLVIVNLVIGPEPKNINFGVINLENGVNWDSCISQPTVCNAKYLSCVYLNLLSTSAIKPVISHDSIVSGHVEILVSLIPSN